MATVPSAAPANRLVFYDIDWKTYRRLLRAFEERPGVRLTYDRGSLEIMILSYEHENHGYLLARMADTVSEELGLPIAGGGSTTFKRRKKKRGLEPDKCFWITHETQVRGKDRIDLRVDPPPDLVIEVDVTHSSLDRMAIYAVLGVPEVWRYVDGKLSFHLREATGKYGADSPSACFPGLNAAALMPFLAMRGRMDANAIVQQVRTWVRQQLAAGVLRRPMP
jgi:Uma2 family endonuclease